MRPTFIAAAAALLALAPATVHAEFLNPDLATLNVETVTDPDWLAGMTDGVFVGTCLSCELPLLMQVEILDDDGTGGRVHSGETTADTYTEIGKANAARLGGDAAYFGTEPIEFGSARGFRTTARAVTGDYSTTYQLWSDGKQLVVKALGSEQNAVDDLAEKAYRAAAPLSFR